jgi:hypothetical protein
MLVLNKNRYACICVVVVTALTVFVFTVTAVNDCYCTLLHTTCLAVYAVMNGAAHLIMYLYAVVSSHIIAVALRLHTYYGTLLTNEAGALHF